MGEKQVGFGTPAAGVRGAVLIAAVAACCALSAAPVRAQLQDERTVLIRSEATTPPARGWTGEAGGSGHPLMTPQAILAAASNFQNCIAQLWPQAAKRGVSLQTFQTYTADLEPDLHIMDLLDAQPEFTKALWDYLDLLVNDARIAAGREILARYQPVFAAVEKAYGVDRHVIAAIWGIESNFGSAIGERSVLQSTATLACIGRRQDYFREEFLSTLEILHRGDVRPDRLKGSWAGAFGPTQFMPSSFKRFAARLTPEPAVQRGRVSVIIPTFNRASIGAGFCNAPATPGPNERYMWRCCSPGAWQTSTSRRQLRKESAGTLPLRRSPGKRMVRARFVSQSTCRPASSATSAW